jgi:hypothetical protein
VNILWPPIAEIGQEAGDAVGTKHKNNTYNNRAI